jgi:hypothetical protein
MKKMIKRIWKRICKLFKKKFSSEPPEDIYPMW